MLTAAAPQQIGTAASQQELSLADLAHWADQFKQHIKASNPGARVASLTHYMAGSKPYPVPDPPPGGCRYIFLGGMGGSRHVTVNVPGGGSVPLSISDGGGPAGGGAGGWGLNLGPALFGSGRPAVVLPPHSSFAIADCSGPRVCAVEGCGITEGLRKCGRCGAVRYCSREHQLAHWAAHKAECRRLAAAQQAAAAEAESAAAEAAQAGAAEAGAAEAGGSSAAVTDAVPAKTAAGSGAGKAGAADAGASEEGAAAEESAAEESAAYHWVPIPP